VTAGESGERWIEVAAAVIERPDGSFLLAQRPAGKVYEGWWEFPGGKVESGEAVAHALGRELVEELGVEVLSAYPWICRKFRYPHGNVRLHFFRVTQWRGEPLSREGQAFAWQTLPDLTVSPILPANGPILASLALPLVLGITPAGGHDPASRFRADLDAALTAGLRFVQVRAHDLPPGARVEFTRTVLSQARAVGAKVVLNGTVDEAIAAGADGLHLTATALRRVETRPELPLVGASCHDADELDRAESLGLDYAVLGAVCPTASHPGGEGMGWSRFETLVAGRTLPIYAIGGLGLSDLHAARTAGAHGVACIRGAWVAPS
jgi:8-oxo-dGTP diphosphatase